MNDADSDKRKRLVNIGEGEEHEHHSGPEDLEGDICKRIVHETRDAIFSFNQDGTYRFVNPAFAKPFGKTPDQIIGKSPHDIFSHEEAEKRLTLVRKVFATGERGEIEVKVVTAAGETRYFLTGVDPVKDETGSVKYVTCISKDITERKLAEENLLHHKTKLDLAIESSGMGLWQFNIRDNKRVFDNQVCALLGINPATFSGTAEEFFDVVHPDDREMVKTALKNTIEKNVPYEPEYRVVWPDGSVHHICARGKLQNDDLGNPHMISAIIWDVTKRRNTEDALRASESRFAALLQNIESVAIQGYSEDGTTQYWNKASEAVYGYSAEEAVGRNLLDLVIPPEMRSDVEQAVRQMTQTGKPIPAEELSLLRKDGTRVSVFSNHTVVNIPGRPKELFCLDVDITTRKKAEQQLKESKALIEAIVENIPLMIFLKDVNLRFVVFNRAGEELTGFDSKSLLGKSDEDFFPPEQAAHFMAKDREVLNGDSGMLDIPEEHIMTAKNAQRILHTRKVGLKGADGETKYLLGISEDITDRKKQEAENIKLNAQLAQAQKLESIGVLAGGIAHDFNNILAPIVLISEMAKSNVDENSSLASDLDDIIKAANKGAEITRSILAYSRKQALKIVKANLNSVINGFMPTLKRMVGEDIIIHQNFGNNLCDSMVDTMEIERIVNNLVTNARHAMPRGGTLIMETRNVHFDKKCEHPGDFIEFSIEDTGTGISPENLPKIFDPFFTTKGVGEGTGLGLPMIQGSVLQQGGFVEVDTVLGKGTKFRLYFKSTGDRTGMTNIKESREQPVKGTETVMVVEDEPSVRQVAAKLLRRCGYTVLEAENAGTAFLILKNMEEENKKKKENEEEEDNIDLVLTDIKMPHMSGTTLGKSIEDTYPKTRVIYMSGYPDEGEDALKGKAFISKPFSSLSLSRKVREVLDGKKKKMKKK